MGLFIEQRNKVLFYLTLINMVEPTTKRYTSLGKKNAAKKNKCLEKEQLDNYSEPR